MRSMNFERSGSGGSFEQREIMDKAATKAEQSLKEQAIDMRDFVEVYGVETVQKDIDYVNKVGRSIRENETADEREASRAATVAEEVVSKGIGLYDWFGPTAYSIVPTRFDDIVNGIDGVVEFENEPGQASHLGLAIDATYRQDSESKLYKLEKKIVSGEPMVMKYFKSEALDFTGQLGSLPKTVAAFDYATIARLGEMYLNGDKKALASDPVQFQILEQLKAQCELFEKVAGKSDRPNLKTKYEHARALLGDIYSQRQNEIEDDGRRDTNSYHLLAAIDSMKKG